MKHNNQLPNVHFHKDWQLRVKTWFDQPGRKKRRRLNRIRKATSIAPRPIQLLRPAVRCPTVRYNTKLRAGRGFTLDELKEAGVRRKEALTLGIPVDHRRKNRSVESLALNVQRLKTYQSKLIVFPKKTRAKKKADAMKVDSAETQQLKGSILPIEQKWDRSKARTITDEEKGASAYATLRKLRTDARLVGIRDARRKAKEEEEANKKK